MARFFGDNNLLPGTLGPVAAMRRSDRDRARADPRRRSMVSPTLRLAPAGSPGFAAFRPEAIAFDGKAGGRWLRCLPRSTEVSFGGASTVASCRAAHAPTASTVLTRPLVQQGRRETRLDTGPPGHALPSRQKACWVVPL